MFRYRRPGPLVHLALVHRGGVSLVPVGLCDGQPAHFLHARAAGGASGHRIRGICAASSVCGSPSWRLAHRLLHRAKSHGPSRPPVRPGDGGVLDDRHLLQLERRLLPDRRPRAGMDGQSLHCRQHTAAASRHLSCTRICAAPCRNGRWRCGTVRPCVSPSSACRASWRRRSWRRSSAFAIGQRGRAFHRR